MTNKNDGGPAFPTPMQHEDWREDYPGLSLRDYFAGKAIEGVFANGVESAEDGKAYIAMHAYRMADAMLKARK